MKNVNPVLTALNRKKTLILAIFEKLCTSQSEYNQRIDKIIHAMTGIRSDLANTISKLSQYIYNPRIKHQTALDYILKYLKETANVAIVYNFNSVGDFVSFTDLALKGNMINRNSTDASKMLLGKKVVI